MAANQSLRGLLFSVPSLDAAVHAGGVLLMTMACVAVLLPPDGRPG